MLERRILSILLLLMLAVAGWIWWSHSHEPSPRNKSPEETDAEKRTGAEPFPDAPSAK